MSSEVTPKPVARRIGDRLACLKHGHSWTHARVTLGDTRLVRSECRRCGSIGAVESARQEARPEVL